MALDNHIVLSGLYLCIFQFCIYVDSFFIWLSSLLYKKTDRLPHQFKSGVQIEQIISPQTGCSPSTNQRPFPLLLQIPPIFVHAPLSRNSNNLMTVVAPSLLSLAPGISEDPPEASNMVSLICR